MSSPAHASRSVRPGGTRRPRAERRTVAGRSTTGLRLGVLLVACVLYFEVILRAQTESPFVNDGLLFMTLFAGATALVAHLVASFFTGVGRSVVVGLFVGVTTVLFMTQLIYHDIFGTFYTVFSATRAGQVLEFTKDIASRSGDNVGWLLLMSVPLLVFIALMRGAWVRHRFSWKERGTVAALMAALFAVALAGINLGDREQNSPYDMYYRSHYPVASVNRLGLLTSMRLDLQRTLLGFEPDLPPPPDVAPTNAPPVAVPQPDEDNPGQTPAPNPAATSPEASPGTDATVEEPVVREANAMDIDFEALMSAASGEELRNMHLYFQTREPSLTNEHTGMFEGYNLIFLTAEGYSHYAVDQDVTPTLYRMTHEGFNFTNFYTPIWGVSTSDGEYVATTGLIPKSGVWSMYRSGANSMPFAMGNQLGRAGYRTLAYHNHTFDYYNRDVSHPNLGYVYKGLGNGLEVTRTWPESDIEMIDVTTEEYIRDEPFHAYYMTVSGHLEYNFGGNFIAHKNRGLVQGLPHSDAGKAYMATQIELDRALELLMERLEEAGVADNTLIVMSSDHYPYGLKKNEIDDLAGHQVENNFELYRNSLVIYAKGMEPEVIDRPTSSLDILPTLSNLMGLEFDSRLLMGVDAFSEKDPVVIFSNRSFITDQGRYNSVTREFTPHDGVDLPEDYRKRISDEIDRQFYYSTMVLDTDYYSLVVDR